jgi:P-type Mg2+ transporter
MTALTVDRVHDRRRRRDRAEPISRRAAQEASTTLEVLFKTLKTSPWGLAERDADDRLDEFGLNEVAHERALPR